MPYRQETTYETLRRHLASHSKTNIYVGRYVGMGWFDVSKKVGTPPIYESFSFEMDFDDGHMGGFNRFVRGCTYCCSDTTHRRHRRSKH